MSYIVSRHKKEHVDAVAKKYGLTSVTVDAIIDAYIADMCDTLKEGINVNIPRLVTVVVKQTSQGYKTYGMVSKTLRQELRTQKVDRKDTQTISAQEKEHEKENAQQKVKQIGFKLKTGIDGLTTGDDNDRAHT